MARKQHDSVEYVLRIKCVEHVCISLNLCYLANDRPTQRLGTTDVTAYAAKSGERTAGTADLRLLFYSELRSLPKARVRTQTMRFVERSRDQLPTAGCTSRQSSPFHGRRRCGTLQRARWSKVPFLLFLSSFILHLRLRLVFFASIFSLSFHLSISFFFSFLREHRYI